MGDANATSAIRPPPAKGKPPIALEWSRRGSAPVTEIYLQHTLEAKSTAQIPSWTRSAAQSAAGVQAFDRIFSGVVYPARFNATGPDALVIREHPPIAPLPNDTWVEVVRREFTKPEGVLHGCWYYMLVPPYARGTGIMLNLGWTAAFDTRSELAAHCAARGIHRLTRFPITELGTMPPSLVLPRRRRSRKSRDLLSQQVHARHSRVLLLQWRAPHALPLSEARTRCRLTTSSRCAFGKWGTTRRRSARGRVA
jgi:hypothetical protein